uniref:Coagulation factor II (Thrombin) receptor n=1 Tax=Nothobranchius kuhntae TaxID=321403 RepID=A0A1A8KWH5_NOTKU
MVTDEPVDYVDLSAVDDVSGDGDSGSELKPQSVKRHHHHPSKLYFVSEETKEFLQGHLATALIPTIYTLVFIISVPLNLVAAVMFVHRIRPRKPAVIYMLNLACSDLLFGLLLPFKIAYHYHGNNWIYGSFLCRAVTAAFHCNMYCSVLLMTCIGVDRFLAVVYPMKSLTWRSPQTAAAVCAAMWLVSLGGIFPLLISDQTIYLSDLGITTCHDALAAANVDNRSKKTRAIVMTVVVLLVFVVCFTPTNVILMAHYVQMSHSSNDCSYKAYLLSLCVSSISCCLDPVLYYYGSSQCQKQVTAMLRCRRLTRADSSSETHSSRTSGSTISSRSSKMESIHAGLGSQYNRLNLKH